MWNSEYQEKKERKTEEDLKGKEINRMISTTIVFLSFSVTEQKRF